MHMLPHEVLDPSFPDQLTYPENVERADKVWGHGEGKSVNAVNLHRIGESKGTAASAHSALP